MNELNTEIIAALANKQDIGEVFRHSLEDALNDLLQAELTAFLGYQSYQRPEKIDNYRNGYYLRKLTTKYGELTLQVPRDRTGEFKQQTITPYQRPTDSLEDMVTHLYRHGKLPTLSKKCMDITIHQQPCLILRKTLPNKLHTSIKES